METLIVEQSYETPLSEEEEYRLARRVDTCLEQHGARWLRSYIAADRRRMICEFEAPDAEAVRASYRAAGAPFDRVWKATVYAAEPSRSAGEPMIST